MLTVSEALLFAARLRLPEYVTDAEKRQRVEDVLEQLGLTHVRDARIGGQTSHARGISGGEMRRVSVGLELVASPDILILDEPTSGLSLPLAHTYYITDFATIFQASTPSLLPKSPQSCTLSRMIQIIRLPSLQPSISPTHKSIEPLIVSSFSLMGVPYTKGKEDSHRQSTSQRRVRLAPLGTTLRTISSTLLTLLTRGSGTTQVLTRSPAPSLSLHMSIRAL